MVVKFKGCAIYDHGFWLVILFGFWYLRQMKKCFRIGNRFPGLTQESRPRDSFVLVELIEIRSKKEVIGNVLMKWEISAISLRTKNLASFEVWLKK